MSIMKVSRFKSLQNESEPITTPMVVVWLILCRL